eukprot:103027_1
MSFDDISAITLYTINEIYRPLNKSLRSRKDEWAPFCGPLLSGLNKLPATGKQKLYRGTKSKTIKKRIEQCYKVDAVIRWDVFTSTSSDYNVVNGFSVFDNVATNVFSVFEIESFLAVDIELFSAIPSEKELLFSPSSHFLIRNINISEDQTVVKLKELPYPWDSKAVLLVNDSMKDYKNLMDECRSKGVMVIPRISTYGAKEFVYFMRNALDFNKLHVVTNMCRNEYPEDDEKKPCKYDKYAGARLIVELRKAGYNNVFCLYGESKQRIKALCKEANVYDNKIFITESIGEAKSYMCFETRRTTEFSEQKEMKDFDVLETINSEQGKQIKTLKEQIIQCNKSISEK